MLKIYGRKTSSNVQKVLWCCGEIGLAFERDDVGGEVWKMLEAQLAKTPFVAGKELTAGDIALGNAVHRWFRFPIHSSPLTGAA